jgi:serine/threonine protein phosphatase PrpC
MQWPWSKHRPEQAVPDQVQEVSEAPLDHGEVAERTPGPPAANGQPTPGADPADDPPIAHPPMPDMTAPREPAKDSQPGSGPLVAERGENEVAHTVTTSREFPEPLVLLGNPSLGSQPRGLPDVEPAVSDTVLDGADLPGLAIRGASLRGDDHRYMTEPRQDSMGIWRIADPGTEAILICVADGVGSEPVSHLGSAEACRLLRDEARRHLAALLAPDRDEDVPALCRDLAQGVALRLDDLARRLAIAPKSLSTTLVGALIETRPTDPGRRRCVIVSVGDSTAFLLRDGSFLPCLPNQHEGDITSTRVDALPAASGLVATRIVQLRPTDMLMICTDGLSNPMQNEEVRRKLAAWWASDRIPGLPEFGWQLSFRAQSFGDDRTAVCAWGR